MRVALLDDYYDTALASADWARLGHEVVRFTENVPEPARLADMLQGFGAVVMMRERTRFPRELIERLPELRLLITTAMWNASIDLDACTEQGVTVCGTRDHGHLTAELTLGLMIACARRIPFAERELRAGRWQRDTMGESLKGKRLGVVGLGRLGRQVAAFGKVLGMEVVAWSANLTAESAAEAGATLVTKDELFATSDMVTLHQRLSDRSRGIVDADSLARMKPSAWLINTSRGPLIDADALYDALAAHRIAGAALDVYWSEPLPPTDRFLTLDNVIALPHLGYVTKDNWEIFYGDALADVEAFLKGAPERCMNPEVLTSPALRGPG